LAIVSHASRLLIAGPKEAIMTSSNSLSTKERALIGIGAAIAAGCQPCTRILIQSARKAGACERGIRLAIESGLVARANATEAMAHWGESEQGEPPILDATFRAEKERLASLIVAGASYAANSTATLHREVELAEAQEWSNPQIAEALAIGRAVAKTAAQKVEASATCLGFSMAAQADPECSAGPSPTADQPPPTGGCGCA
jgi:hypothetical protein